MEMVVECSLMIDVSVRGGILTMASSSWEENVITLKSKRKQKNKILLRCIIILFSLINYLPPPERYAKGYSKYFSKIQWSLESLVYLIAFCTNKK
jgi:hypothetical protein